MFVRQTFVFAFGFLQTTFDYSILFFELTVNEFDLEGEEISKNDGKVFTTTNLADHMSTFIEEEFDLIDRIQGNQ